MFFLWLFQEKLKISVQAEDRRLKAFRKWVSVITQNFEYFFSDI